MYYILILGILLVLGLASTRVMRIWKLPNVTGYLVVGILIALGCVGLDHLTASDSYPQGLGLVESLTKLNEDFSSVALGFIALSIGAEFQLAKIKSFGKRILTITFLQAFGAILLVDVAVIVLCICLGLSPAIGICLGAIATATAPAATLMVIHQYKAKGPLVDILLPVVAFDDAIGLIFFAISVAIAKVIATGEAINAMSLVLFPLLEIIGSLVIGFVLGYLMHLMIKFFKSRNNHVITLIAFTLLGVGTCEVLNFVTGLEFSNLLCCLMIGAVYINFAQKGNDKEIVERDFGLVDRWTPALFMLFFVLSGAHLVTSAKELLGQDINFVFVIIIFAAYIICRSLGKYFGAFISCKAEHQPESITKYLGITLLPQAGVAIGMANQISGMEAFKADGIGDIIVTVVLCATLVYELVGPLLTKMALTKAGEIPNEDGFYPYMLNAEKSNASTEEAAK